MLTWRWIAPLWTVAALAGVAWGVVGLYSSKQPPQQTYQEASSERTTEKSDQVSQAQEADDRIAAYTLWLAIFTGALVVVSAIQIGFLVRAEGATRHSLDLAREEFVSTHRPKLIVRQFQLDPISANSFIRIWHSIINVGDTEATLTFTTSQAALWNPHESFWEAPGIDPVIRPILPNPITIRSGQRVSATAESAIEVTDNQFRAILARNLIVCAVGEITYRDGLGTDRRVGFRRNYDVGADMFTASENTDQEYQD
jgi:hypothetical protein